MRLKRDKSGIMPIILTLLVLATLITGVLAANSLLEMGDNTPTATISIPAISDTVASAEASAVSVADTATVIAADAATEIAVASTVMQSTATAAATPTTITAVATGTTTVSAQSSVTAMTGRADTAAASRVSSAWTAAPLDLLMENGRTVWSGDTEVDIFSISYDNEAGETTVNSAYTDTVIAPGTSDQYLVYIENNGNAAVDYTLTAEGSASFTMDGEAYTIPVEVRLTDSDQNYLAGSESTWTAVEELDTVSDSGVLSAGYYTAYTLDWRWLFEQEDIEAGDAYDTWLGNLAASGETLAVTIRFTVHAENDEDENAIGGYPKTGDYQPIILWFVLVILLFILFLYLLSNRKKERR